MLEQDDNVAYTDDKPLNDNIYSSNLSVIFPLP
jgi:hypothetical protein